MRTTRIGDILARSRSIRTATRTAIYSGTRKTSSGRNSSSGKTNALMDKLNGTKNGSSLNSTQAVTAVQKKTSHAAVEKYAATLQDYTEEFLSDEKDSLFAAAENAEEGSTKEKQAVLDKVNQWVDAYNSMVTNMASTGDTVNNMYLRQLNTYFSLNKDSLKAVGITQNSNGTLRVSQTALSSASLKEIKSVFGVKTGFADRVSERAKIIESNAAKNLSSISSVLAQSSSSYNSSGVLNEVYASIQSAFSKRG